MKGFGIRWVGIEDPTKDRLGLVKAPRASEFQAAMMIGHGGHGPVTPERGCQGPS